MTEEIRQAAPKTDPFPMNTSATPKSKGGASFASIFRTKKKGAPKARTPTAGVRTFGAFFGSGKWTPFLGRCRDALSQCRCECNATQMQSLSDTNAECRFSKSQHSLSPHSHSSICIIPQASALPPSSTSHSNGTSTSTNYHSRHETVTTCVQRPCKQQRPPRKTSAVRLCTSGRSQARTMRAERLLARGVRPCGGRKKRPRAALRRSPAFRGKSPGRKMCRASYFRTIFRPGEAGGGPFGPPEGPQRDAGGGKQRRPGD